jgi:hypothetical protein
MTAMFPGSCNVRDDGNQRDGGTVGLGEGRGEIRRARTNGCVTDARPPGKPGIGVGGITGASFIPHQDMLDSSLELADTLIQGQGLATRDAINVFNAVLKQQFCQSVSDFHLFS